MTAYRRLATLPLPLLLTARRLTSSRFSPSGKSLPSSPPVLTTSRRFAPLPLLLIALLALGAVLLWAAPIGGADRDRPGQEHRPDGHTRQWTYSLPVACRSRRRPSRTGSNPGRLQPDLHRGPVRPPSVRRLTSAERNSPRRINEVNSGPSQAQCVLHPRSPIRLCRSVLRQRL